MRTGSRLLLVIFLVTTVGTACKGGADADLSKLGPSSAATTTVLPVGSQTCPGGGIGIYTGNDTNANGVLEAAEILKGSPVCDQMTDAGSPAGNGALAMVVSEPSSTLHCLAGGLKVLSGMDANKNGLLDANEIGFTDYLCNGTPGSSSATGITVALGASAAPCTSCDGKKKGKKASPAKKPAAAAGKAPGKSADKAASKQVKEAKSTPAAPEEKAPSAEPAAPPKKVEKKERAQSTNKEKSASATPPAAPKGWTSVKTGSPQLASVAYRIEGRSITVRFTNLSNRSTVRFKYTVRWKMNQNGKWVDDSTMEGIGFSLKESESLDREVRTSTQDIRDVVIDIDTVETS